MGGEIKEEAHRARERRARGEPERRSVDQLSGVEVCGLAVSFGGGKPPESVRAALYRLTHERETPGVLDAELTQAFNAATREALRRAFVLFAGEK